jgi:hypothetical protein
MLEDLGKRDNSLFPQVQLVWTVLYPPFLPTHSNQSSFQRFQFLMDTAIN